MGGHWGALGDPRGGSGGTCGRQGWSWESLGGAWGALGSPCGDLGVPWGGPRGSSGALGDPFWGYWAIDKSLKNLMFYCVFTTRRILEVIGELQGDPREPKGRPRVAQGGPKGSQGETCGRPRGPRGGRGGGFEPPLELERSRTCFFELSGVHYWAIKKSLKNHMFYNVLAT